MEMDLNMIAASPKAPVIVETEKKYVEIAKISVIVADHIRRMGYDARAHIAGSNYQAILPPLAWRAGLGEIGRIGILITERFGPRVRLGLVTTDLPLTPDSPRIFGVQNFCNICKKCANNCPAQAIPYEEKKEENGALKWVLNREACYRFWRKAGTDCAMCLYVCPYSKPKNWFHDSVRKLISQSSTAQRVSLWADDYFYGVRPLPKASPF
jgi:reductive dehalogenase